MSKFPHPIPPDFTLDSGLVITHDKEQAPEGISISPEWIGDAYEQKKKWFIENYPMGERICRMFGL